MAQGAEEPEEGHRETSTKRVLNIRVGVKRREGQDSSSAIFSPLRHFIYMYMQLKNILPVIFHLKVSELHWLPMDFNLLSLFFYESVSGNSL